MDQIPVGLLIGILAFLVLLSAFFSAAEISLISLNRYRLKHLVEQGHRGARLAHRLLHRPDRLIGVILLGSNVVNALATSIATVTAIRLFGSEESVIAAVTLVVALVILIFTDLAPKTLAALKPERLAFPSSYVLTALLKVAYPVVWAVNGLANGLLRLAGVKVGERPTEKMSVEELRVVLMESGVLMPERHQEMLLAILDLENMTVEDVMIPRHRIEALDLDEDADTLVSRATTSRYTRMPVCRGNLDHVVGFVHLRQLLNLERAGQLTPERLATQLQEPYFVPLHTPLGTQLLHFRAQNRRMGLVVDEYGDVQGMVTIEEILEEIVGDFTRRAGAQIETIQPQPDGSHLINGGVHLREINRHLDWDLPTDGPKTLSGLITEHLEDLPEMGTSMLLDGYLVEVVRTRGSTVQWARVRPHGNESEQG